MGAAGPPLRAAAVVRTNPLYDAVEERRSRCRGQSLRARQSHRACAVVAFSDDDDFLGGGGDHRQRLLHEDDYDDDPSATAAGRRPTSWSSAGHREDGDGGVGVVVRRVRGEREREARTGHDHQGHSLGPQLLDLRL